MKKVDIIGFDVFNGSMEELINYAVSLEKAHIVSGNPEVLYNGLSNDKLSNNFKKESTVIIPDGIGTILASKIVKQPIKEKIAGIEVMGELLKYCEKNHKSIYLLGAQNDILDECKKNIKKLYPNINIVGSHDGYFDLDKCDEIIENIKNCNPYALFVAMGSPRQELFIIKYEDKLSCNIFMGVGGSFDVLAGRVKRAPNIMVSMGLEWLYRVAKEPWRIARLKSIPKFLLKVAFNRK